MSVFRFDPNDPKNPFPYLAEKSLLALREAARLVDLANEPDTAEWYAKELRARAERMISRLVLVVGVAYQTGPEAVQRDAWAGIVERGSFALAKWCKEFDIEHPMQREFGLVVDPDEEAEVPEASKLVGSETLVPMDAEQGAWVRIQVYGTLCRTLADDELTRGERRLLAWLLSSLQFASYADIAEISRRFLPRDIDCPHEETVAAYRGLWDRGLIRRVDGLCEEDRLALRLIAGGLNNPKNTIDYRDEDFGREGDWINGKRTTISRIHVELPETLATVLARWRVDYIGLREHLQERVGVHRVVIGQVGPALLADGLDVAPSLSGTRRSGCAPASPGRSHRYGPRRRLRCAS